MAYLQRWVQRLVEGVSVPGCLLLLHGLAVGAAPYLFLPAAIADMSCQRSAPAADVAAAVAGCCLSPADPQPFRCCYCCCRLLVLFPSLCSYLLLLPLSPTAAAPAGPRTPSWGRGS